MPALLIIGLVIILGGGVLFAVWFEYLWELIKAILPLTLIGVGGVIAYFGWEEKKDRKGAFLDFSSPTEASRYQAEALAYQEKINGFNEDAAAADPASYGDPGETRAAGPARGHAEGTATRIEIRDASSAAVAEAAQTPPDAEIQWPADADQASEDAEVQAPLTDGGAFEDPESRPADDHRRDTDGEAAEDPRDEPIQVDESIQGNDIIDLQIQVGEGPDREVAAVGEAAGTGPEGSGDA
ncbi:MAG: hypothetical protein LBR80_16895 [Deltaproteobacteria bacterium]|jgi:hypothetical protein|nr:hypothetical protein [Deltaproteobacteria bacterium]